MTESPTTGSSDPALEELHIPLTQCVGSRNATSKAYVVGRRDLLAVIGNWSKRNELWLKILVLVGSLLKQKSITQNLQW
jgi:hypothetical protein